MKCDQLWKAIELVRHWPSAILNWRFEFGFAWGRCFEACRARDESSLRAPAQNSASVSISLLGTSFGSHPRMMAIEFPRFPQKSPQSLPFLVDFSKAIGQAWSAPIDRKLIITLELRLAIVRYPTLTFSSSSTSQSGPKADDRFFLFFLSPSSSWIGAFRHPCL